MEAQPTSRALLVAGLGLVILLVLSGWHPYDRLTWVLEVFPILIALPLMAATYPRFPLTRLLYTLIFLHACILMLGGAYTYARVPLGFWMAKVLGTTRNPYDKLGHFAQGFVPAILAREVLLRKGHLKRGGMAVFLILSVVLAISALYELIEWVSALALGQGADEFLGTQGDPWDTQSDMAMALVGGSMALLLLSKRHDRQLAKLAPTA
jgi:putative membrane protein